MFERYCILDESDIALAGQKMAVFETAETKVGAEVRAVAEKLAQERVAGNAYNIVIVVSN